MIAGIVAGWMLGKEGDYSVSMSESDGSRVEESTLSATTATTIAPM